MDDPDFRVVDDEHFFIRAQDDVWVEITEDAFKRFVDVWEIEGREAEPPVDGRLADGREVRLRLRPRRRAPGRSMRIDHVRAHEADRLRELRLASLQADPHAFGATYESDAARPPSWWERGARLSDAGEEQRTFVVVGDDGRWLGMALVRPDDETPGGGPERDVGRARGARPRQRAGAVRGVRAVGRRARLQRAAAPRSSSATSPRARPTSPTGFVFERTDTWTGHGRTLEELVFRRPLR